MELLKERIRRDGKVKGTDVLKVDSFLNHQMDVELFAEIGKEFKRRFAGCEINKILTIEASGIGIACVVAQYFHCPVIFAKKTQTKNIAGEVYTSKVESFTHGRVYDIIVAKEFLGPGDKVLLIDDFLANGAALEGLAQVSDPAVSSAPGVFASFFGPDTVNLLGVVLLTSLGTWGLPQMVQKFYAIKSDKSIDAGTVISTLFALVVAGGCYFLGGFGRLFADRMEVVNGVPVGGYDAVIPTMLSGLPDLLMAVVVILVLSASMSTLSSLVLTSSSTLTLDLIRDHLVKGMSQKRQVLVMRCLIVVFIAISVVLAIIQYKSNVTFIAQLMGVSWGALAGAFLAPFLYGLYWKKATRAACWTSFLFSTVVMTANIFFQASFPALLRSPINAGAFCMLAGLVLVPVVSLLTPQPDAALVEDAFSCYDEKVLVRQSQALGDK